MTNAVTVEAPAKINVDLRILATRADNYHELSTIFQTIALRDTLTVSRAGAGIAITCSDPGVPTDRRNLVWKAVEAVRETLGAAAPADGVHVDLFKRIPSQAGLGGGSSDAAAVIGALEHLWSVSLAVTDRRRIARALGADVPFFLRGGTALGLGRGDDLVPLAPLPPWPVVVVHPGFGVATADAYRWYDEDRVPASSPGEWPAETEGWRQALAACRNDLEGPVADRHPAIARLVAWLRRQGALHAAMSGSGSAVFAIFEDEETARAAAEPLDRPGVGLWLTRLTSS